MNPILKSECGRPLIEVEYDTELLNWNEVIQAAYSLHCIRPGQARVIARPKRHNSGLQVGIKVGKLPK
jgi:hypothetical protein